MVVVSYMAVFVLKRDVRLQPTNEPANQPDYVVEDTDDDVIVKELRNICLTIVIRMSTERRALQVANNEERE